MLYPQFFEDTVIPPQAGMSQIGCLWGDSWSHLNNKMGRPGIIHEVEGHLRSIVNSKQAFQQLPGRDQFPPCSCLLPGPTGPELCRHTLPFHCRSILFAITQITFEYAEYLAVANFI